MLAAGGQQRENPGPAARPSRRYTLFVQPKVILPHAAALEALCRRFSVKRLELFGSAVTADFDAARSDLDFVVEFFPCSPSAHADACFGLLFALEKLFGRKIDLIEEAAITNPLFLLAIANHKVPLYAAA